MNVRVLLFARLKEIAKADHLVVNLPATATVTDLKRAIARTQNVLAGWLECCVFSVNGEWAEENRVLSESDDVAMLPPASGGASGIILSESPIEPARVLDGMDGVEEGAVVLFLGKVREKTGEKLTKKLVYEAYEPVAILEIGKIISRARNDFQLGDIRVQHRLGEVEPGHVSIAVAVSSQHRREAFDGCAFIMDQIKAFAPIWKKEIKPDGEGFWVHPGSPEDGVD